eukprot:COSAG06_NODE_4021_length_4653_cov_1.498463_8_plen_71_part_01
MAAASTHAARMRPVVGAARCGAVAEPLVVHEQRPQFFRLHYCRSRTDWVCVHGLGPACSTALRNDPRRLTP